MILGPISPFHPAGYALPLAFGIIIGEYAVGVFWSAMSVILHQTTYDFAPG